MDIAFSNFNNIKSSVDLRGWGFPFKRRLDSTEKYKFVWLVLHVRVVHWKSIDGIDGYCFQQLVKPPDLWVWERLNFSYHPCPASLLGWHAMVFADKTNLLLWAWQCASLSAPTSQFRWNCFVSLHISQTNGVISIEIRSTYTDIGF